MKSHDIFQSVTDTIINLLETHQQSWDKPWIAMGIDNEPARNAKTQRYYTGINQFLLSLSLLDKGYFKNMWLTFKQTKDLGGHIKKGEKSSPILFYRTAYIDQDKKYYKPETVEAMSPKKQDEIGIRSIPIPKLYRVFNVAQTEDLDPALYEAEPKEPLQDFEKDERAEQLILSTGAEIEIVESNRAYYVPATDKIRVPLREQFKGTEPFYGTTLHELGCALPHSRNRFKVESLINFF